MDIQNEQENQEDANLTKSEQVEKEELTKKYYSKKKEIKENACTESLRTDCRSH